MWYRACVVEGKGCCWWGVTSSGYRDSRKSQCDIAVAYRLVCVPKGVGMALRLIIWSIDEVVEIDLYQSGGVESSMIEVCSWENLASFLGEVSPGVPGRLAKVC